MGKFNVCARVARSGGPRPSYAWIALHRCVEANARLTGEPFGAIFARLGAAHGFGRSPGRRPDAETIRAALADLEAERAAFLADLNARIAARRAAKRAGRRTERDARLTEIGRLQAAHRVPYVGCWGWRRRRGVGGSG